MLPLFECGRTGAAMRSLRELAGMIRDRVADGKRFVPARTGTAMRKALSVERGPFSGALWLGDQ
jgi:hypothetical protein